MENKKKKEPIKLTIVIILLIAILLVCVNMFMLVNSRIDDLNQDPLQRGAQHYDLNQCSCIGNQGQAILFNKSNTWQIREVVDRGGLFTFESKNG